MKSFSWFKDSLIQIIFISFAVVFTVFIAQISLSEQYTAYYESKLEAKAEMLARNAVLLFSENEGIRNIDGMSYILNTIFPASEDGSERIRYALFDANGQIAASTVENAVIIPQEAYAGIHTVSETPFMRSYCPVLENGAARYILMIQIDDTPFREHSALLSESLYSSLLRGCLMMAAGYMVFSFISNLRKKKQTAVEEKQPEKPQTGKEMFKRVAVQLTSLLSFALLSLPFFIAHSKSDSESMTMLLIGILLLAVAALHLCRILLWLIAWFSKRPISTYAAQTMQFFVFLVIFLSMYVYSIQGGYSTQIDLMLQDKLRMSSVFAGLTLSGAETADENLVRHADSLDHGDHIDCIILTRTESGFTVLGNQVEDMSHAYDLFYSAWETQSSVTGIRGGYKYGVTVIADNNAETIAIAAVRQPDNILADETRSANTDFLLAMSATVFAFVFLFTEMNRLLEVINIPSEKAERGLRYANSTRSLMFLATACRYIPLYFFVLIVNDIYLNHPENIIPNNVAMVLPIAVVLIIMAVGRDIIGWVVRVNTRNMMLFGCVIGMVGFLLLHFAATLPLLLILLVFTYTGVSMVYNGLWDFAQTAENTGVDEFSDMKKHTLSGEYLGGMAGAVIGAMVYDKFGLFAAFALSAAILLILIILLRALLPAGEKPEKTEKGEWGFLKFFFSKNIFIFMFLMLLPFALGEYFIEQFSPLYADSIALSPGAASWTSLLMTVALAYIAPPVLKIFKNVGKTPICVFANILAAAGLLLFALMPSIVTMYAASALIGISVGVGKNILADGYAAFAESRLYANSGYAFNLFGSLFGLLGAALFTLAHIMSSGGEYVIFIAAIIAIATILYIVFSKSGRAE